MQEIHNKSHSVEMTQLVAVLTMWGCLPVTNKAIRENNISDGYPLNVCMDTPL